MVHLQGRLTKGMVVGPWQKVVRLPGWGPQEVDLSPRQGYGLVGFGLSNFREAQ